MSNLIQSTDDCRSIHRSSRSGDVHHDTIIVKRVLRVEKVDHVLVDVSIVLHRIPQVLHVVRYPSRILVVVTNADTVRLELLSSPKERHFRVTEHDTAARRIVVSTLL